MNNNKPIILAFLLLAPFTAQAASEGYNLGIGIGSSNFQLNEAGIISGLGNASNNSSFTDSATSFTFFGGIQLDQHLSVDMDLLLLGDITATENGIKTKLFDVSSLAITVGLSQPFNANITGTGRLGVHLWDVSESTNNDDSLGNAVDLTFGLGLDINVYGDRSRQLRLQWNHYEYDGVYLDSNDTFSLSLLFLFGQDY